MNRISSASFLIDFPFPLFLPQRLKRDVFEPVEGRLMHVHRVTGRDKESVADFFNNAVDAREEGIIVKAANSHYQVSSSRFLDATTYLYKRSCSSVGPSVGPSVCSQFWKGSKQKVINLPGKQSKRRMAEIEAGLRRLHAVLRSRYRRRIFRNWPPRKCFTCNPFSPRLTSPNGRWEDAISYGYGK